MLGFGKKKSEEEKAKEKAQKAEAKARKKEEEVGRALARLEREKKEKEERKKFERELKEAAVKAERREKLEEARGRYDVKAARRTARVSDITSGGEIKYKRKKQVLGRTGATALVGLMIKGRGEAKRARISASREGPRSRMLPSVPMSLYIPKPITGNPFAGMGRITQRRNSLRRLRRR